MFILETHKTKMNILVQEPTEEMRSYMFIGANFHEYPCHDFKT